MPGLEEYPPFDTLRARGVSTLYSAVMEAQSFANGRLAGYLMAVGAHPNRTSFALLFTAGVDDAKQLTLEQLLRFLRYEPVEEPRGPRPDLHKTLLASQDAGTRGGDAAPRYQLTVPVFLVVYGEHADRPTLERITATAGGALIDARGQSPEAVARRLAALFRGNPCKDGDARGSAPGHPRSSSRTCRTCEARSSPCRTWRSAWRSRTAARSRGGSRAARALPSRARG